MKVGHVNAGVKWDGLFLMGMLAIEHEIMTNIAQYKCKSKRGDKKRSHTTNLPTCGYTYHILHDDHNKNTKPHVHNKTGHTSDSQHRNLRMARCSQMTTPCSRFFSVAMSASKRILTNTMAAMRCSRP